MRAGGRGREVRLLAKGRARASPGRGSRRRVGRKGQGCATAPGGPYPRAPLLTLPRAAPPHRGFSREHQRLLVDAGHLGGALHDDPDAGQGQRYKALLPALVSTQDHVRHLCAPPPRRQPETRSEVAGRHRRCGSGVPLPRGSCSAGEAPFRGGLQAP